MKEFVWGEALVPLWEGDIVYEETAMLLADRWGGLPEIGLLCPVDRILSVRDYGRRREYCAGRDYALTETGDFSVPDGSALYDLACPYDRYYQERYIPGVNRPMLGGGAQLRTEASGGCGGLTDFQFRIIYRPRTAFPGPIPPAKGGLLPRTAGRLKRGEHFTVALLGDSISAGWSASGFAGLPPFQPPYFRLFTEALRQRCPVREHNLSVGGKTSVWGREAAQTAALAAAEPDLAIVAFGMNDGASERMTAEIFRGNVAEIVRAVRSRCPHTEWLLVSPMLPNGELGYEEGISVLQHQHEYAAALAELEREFGGVAVADVTSVHRALLGRKAYRDMSANNINHPNDFLHRVYAQVLLRTLCPG